MIQVIQVGQIIGKQRKQKKKKERKKDKITNSIKGYQLIFTKEITVYFY